MVYYFPGYHMDSFKHLSTFLSTGLLSFLFYRTLSQRIDKQEEDITRQLNQVDSYTSRTISSLRESIKAQKDYTAPYEKLKKEHETLKEKVNLLEDKINELESDFFYKSPHGQHIATLESSTLSL